MCACNEWLDVSPEDEIDEKDLFKTGTGYRHALNGVYFALGDIDLYGQHLSWGVVDAMGQCYDYREAGTNAVNAMEYGGAKYNWEHSYMKPCIESIWKKTYNAVANCNNIIENIADEAPEKFSYKHLEKNMIWGEALALRAYMQFDMLRLFAAAPVTDPGNRTFIPYVSEYPVYVSKALTVDSCLSLVIRDLREAKDLLWKSDSARTDIRTFWETGGQPDMDYFYTNKRGFRLNYYAVSAVLARVYLYAGQMENAYKEAKVLIDFAEEKRVFRIGYNMSSSYYGDFKSYSDILWGVEAVDLLKFVTAVNTVDTDEPKYLGIAGAKINFFGEDMKVEGKQVSCNDLRFQRWVAYQADSYYNVYKFTKHEQRFAAKTAVEICNTLVPMIRMSEMYYIAAEAIYETDLDAAKKYLLKVKNGRGLRSSDQSVINVNAANKSNFLTILQNDARREWMGEGQIFYMYKRLNLNIPAVTSRDEYMEIEAKEDNFVVPLPNIETDLM